MRPHTPHQRILPWLLVSICSLPTSLPATSLITAMNAATVRVLCHSTSGMAGTGSGLLLAGGTNIATNEHVVTCVDEGGKISVLLAAEPPQLVEAQIQARDPVTDLAVLKLNRPVAPPAVRFATLATLEQRDPVVAVGYPSGADDQGDLLARSTATLTEGVIGRLLPRGDGTGPPLVQISAAINPGNSGGPLFDEAGRVVGINTFKALALVPAVTAAGTFGLERVVVGEGLGWAVAVDALLPLLDRLGLPYAVSQRRISAPERWWYREPLLTAVLGLVGLLLLGILAQSTTRTGRARLQAGLTRATRRGGERTAPPAVPAPGPRRPDPTPVSASGVSPPLTPSAPPTRQPLLRVLAGPYAGQTLPLTAQPVAIGRHPHLAQLVLPADQHAISQRHALVGHDAARGGFFVEDCWSTNGVYLLPAAGTDPVRATRLPAGQAQPLPAGSRFYLATPATCFEVDYQ